MSEILSGTLYLFENTYKELGFPTSLDEGTWDLINTGEDIAGSILIATGVTLLATTLPMMAPLFVIGLGSLACFAATGVNEISDLENPYYYMTAASSIIPSLIPGGSEAKIAGVSSSSTIKILSKSVNHALVKNKLTNSRDFIKTSASNYLEGTEWTKILNCYGFYET